MAATYDETEPTPKDRARGLLGDLDVPENALRTDEYILAILAQYTGVGAFELAVAWMADGLVAEYGQEPTNVRLPNGLTVDFARIEVWSSLATRLRAEAAAKIEAAEKAAQAQARRAEVGRIAAGLDWRPR